MEDIQELKLQLVDTVRDLGFVQIDFSAYAETHKSEISKEEMDSVMYSIGSTAMTMDSLQSAIAQPEDYLRANQQGVRELLSGAQEFVQSMRELGFGIPPTQDAIDLVKSQQA